MILPFFFLLLPFDSLYTLLLSHIQNFTPDSARCKLFTCPTFWHSWGRCGYHHFALTGHA